MPSRNAYPDSPRVAVGAVVFNAGSVLLVRRGHAPAEGQWAIPGGSVALGETLQEAAEREIMEETGLTIQAGEPIYAFDTVVRDDTGRIQFHYVIIDVAAEYVSGEPDPGDDADEARWVSPDEIGELDVNKATLRLLKERYGY